MKKFLCLSLFFLMFQTAKSQFPFNVQQYTDSLKSLGETIISGRSDFTRFEANEKFRSLLLFILSHDKAVSIDFSSVKNLSALGSEDKSFRIFTWVVPKTDMSYECFGILCSWNERKKIYSVIELKDVKNDATGADKKVFRKGEWWGALYYEIISVKSNGNKYYTLLGWDGHNGVSTRKVIDVLSLSPMGQPSFGASLFSGYGKQMKRIIFEYSDNVQMILRYEKQAYTIEKKKKKTKQPMKTPTGRTINVSDGFKAQKVEDDGIKRRRKSATMIVFDRLIPLNQSLTGVYSFYVPELNVQDGFLFFKGKWNYIADIDARNPKSPADILPQGQFIGKDPVSNRKVKNKIPENNQ